MSSIKLKTINPSWQRYLLRLGIVFLILLTIPIQGDFYSTLFQISWTYLVSDLFNLVLYLPHFFASYSTFYDWFIILGISIIVSWIWFKRSNNDQEKENFLFYLLRIFARYRLASILFVAGFTKLFAIFAPDLSLSHLNTGYGYFENWKQLYLSLSAAPAYLVFLGIVELLSAFLLLFRKTSFLGVIFIIPFYGNVFFADLAYEGKYFLVPAYIILLTIPIFIYDVKRLGNLIVDFKITQGNRWKFDWSTLKIGQFIWIPKLLFILLFVVLVGYRSYSISQSDSLFYPSTKGIEGISGKYNVDSFVLNGDTLKYSPSDKKRWRDVVFEDWNTLSVRVNDSIKSVQSNRFLSNEDKFRDYEYSQVGDRLYYRYEPTNNPDEFILKNPNPNYLNDNYTFKINRPDSSHISLIGKSLSGDSLEVTLSRINKKYLLEEVKKVGRRKLGFKL